MKLVEYAQIEVLQNTGSKDDLQVAKNRMARIQMSADEEALYVGHPIAAREAQSPGAICNEYSVGDD